MLRHLRAARRVLTGLPLAIGLIALTVLQSTLIGPVFKNHTFVSGLMYNAMRLVLGIKLEFNKASAPLEKNRQAWYVANHMSPADFIVMGSVAKGLFVAAGNLADIGIIKAFSDAAKLLFVSQKKDEKFKQMDRGKIMNAFNGGHNVFMFPEGNLTDGSRVDQFRAGLTAILYGAPATDMKGAPLTLKNKDVVVQPVAITVKSVEGKDVASNPALRDAYSTFGQDDMLKRIWKRLGVREIVLEVTAFEPLEPKNFADEKELMNAAHKLVVGVVAPDQTEVRPAKIGERNTIDSLSPPTATPG